jgi:hypothetical protein
MLEKLQFQQLVEQTLTLKRVTRTMTMYQFVLGMVLAVYAGSSRLNHLRFLEWEPMLTGILKVRRLRPRCTFWRFFVPCIRALRRNCSKFRDRCDRKYARQPMWL